MRFNRCFLFILILLFFNGCASLFLNIPQFLVYETEHYTFYYIQGSVVERDIIEIATEAEKSLEWAESTMEINMILKVDAYLFDDSNNTTYNQILNEFGLNIGMAFKGALQSFYSPHDFNPEILANTILHETCHLIQTYLFSLNSIGIMEGHSTYIAYKYYLYSRDKEYTEDCIINDLSPDITEGILVNQDFPNKIFAMPVSEFVVINFVTMDVYMGNRYEVGASFLSYLVREYGMQKLNEWLYKSDRFNFIANFNRVYPVDFFTAENNWLQLAL